MQRYKTHAVLVMVWITNLGAYHCGQHEIKHRYISRETKEINEITTTFSQLHIHRKSIMHCAALCSRGEFFVGFRIGNRKLVCNLLIDSSHCYKNGEWKFPDAVVSCDQIINTSQKVSSSRCFVVIFGTQRRAKTSFGLRGAKIPPSLRHSNH
jgi:hypothetical protein